MDRQRLLKRLELIEERYKRLAWNALMALSVYEEYLLDQKTSQEVAKSMKDLFNGIPDSLEELQLGDFTEAEDASGNSPDSG
jgi:hypothetical protein